MAQKENVKILARRPSIPSEKVKETLRFEIYVRPGFSHLEVSSIIAVLQAANTLDTRSKFSWQVTSDLPGLVSSRTEILVRAEPAIDAQYLKDYLFVVGGSNCNDGTWMQRARAMQKLRRPVVLLSDAATAYIKSSAPLSGPVTTHWQDARALIETGNFPTLSDRLVENNAGIATGAGRAHTTEIMITLLSDLLLPQDCAELERVMIIESVRSFTGEQPKTAGGNSKFLNSRLTEAISVMEDNVENPLPIAAISERAGISVRQLERLFATQLETSPLRYYKRVRLKLAGKLISDSNLPIVEVALACGFNTSASLSKAYHTEYGMTPHQQRRNRGYLFGNTSCPLNLLD